MKPKGSGSQAKLVGGQHRYDVHQAASADELRGSQKGKEHDPSTEN